MAPGADQTGAIGVTLASGGTGGGGFSAASAESASTNLTPEISVDQEQQLHREYIHFLLSRLNPRPAPWLEEGLSQLLSTITYSATQIEFARLPQANRVTPLEAMGAASTRLGKLGGGVDSSLPAPDTGASTDKAFNESLATAALMPMDQMFAVTRDSPVALNAIGSLWSKQCLLFVHMCLYGEGQRYQKSFLQFLARSAREPITEDLFKQCFDMSYDQMLTVFRGYAQDTDYKSTTFKNGHLPEVPDLGLRDATEPEIGRIKGEALRMAGHPEAAHLTMIARLISAARATPTSWPPSARTNWPEATRPSRGELSWWPPLPNRPAAHARLCGAGAPPPRGIRGQSRGRGRPAEQRAIAADFHSAFRGTRAVPSGVVSRKPTR